MLLHLLFLPCLSFALPAHINSKAGLFPLEIPPLRMPEYEFVSLISPQINLPDLPDWFALTTPYGETGWLDTPSTLYNNAVALLYQNQLQKAQITFSTIIKNHPKSQWYFPSIFWNSQILIRANKYQRAENLLWTLLESEPDFPFLAESTYSLVWIFLKQTRYDKALSLINQFESIFNSSILLERLAYLKYYAYLSNKQYDQSITILQNLIEQYPLSPQRLHYIILLAETLFLVKQWKPISALFNDFVEKYYHSKNMERLLMLDICSNIYLNNWEEVHRLLNHPRFKGFQNPHLLVTTNTLYYLSRNDFINAWKQWNSLQDPQLKNQLLRLFFHKAVAHDQFDDIVKLELDPIYWKSWENEGKLMIAYSKERLGYHEESYLIYQSISQSTTPFIRENALFYLAEIELKLSHYELASSHLQQLLNDFPDSPWIDEYYFWYGLTLYELSIPHNIIALKQVEPSSPRIDDSLFLIGRSYFDQKQWKLSFKSFNLLVNQFSNSPFLQESYFYLARGYFEIHQYKKALSALSKLEKMGTPLRNPIPIIRLHTQILQTLKHYEKADDYLDSQLKQYPNYELIQLRLLVLFALDDNERILQLIDNSFQLSLNAQQISFLNLNKANALFALNRKPKATYHYQLALKNLSQNEQRFVRFRLIKLNFEANKIDTFIKQAQKFVAEEIQDDLTNDVLTLLINYYNQNNLNEHSSPYLNHLSKNYQSMLHSDLSSIKKTELLFKLGEIKNKLGLYSEAETWLNQAMLEDSQYQSLIFQEKGVAALYQKQYVRAIASFLKVIYFSASLSDELKWDILLKIAVCFEEQKYYQDAKAVYMKILKTFNQPKYIAHAQNQLQQLENLKLRKVSRETQ
ncbi:tetratricopeptide repeat protein [Deltaproteobacteria bacterium TL4]